MTTNYNRLVIGVFSRDTDAKGALDEILQLGLAKDQLGFALRDSNAATSSLRKDLMNLGVPVDAATYYENQYNAGCPIVSVDAREREIDVISILHRYGAIDEKNTMAGTASQAGAYNAGATGGQAGAYTAGAAGGQTGTYNAEAAGGQTGGYDSGAMREPQKPFDTGQAKSYDADAVREPQKPFDTGQAKGFDAGTVRDKTSSTYGAAKESITETFGMRGQEKPAMGQQPMQGGQAQNMAAGESKAMNVPFSEQQVDISRDTKIVGDMDVNKRSVQGGQSVGGEVKREEMRMSSEGEILPDTRGEKRPDAKSALDRAKDYIDDKLHLDDNRPTEGPPMNP
ncbi:hypothetical protein KDA_21000 [Dictyobacter alpinus]|uniref:DUF2382 domain-containing protein n=1 Tax=Dictyobacter alpinus TaxID=2014873 RepID=A0A402B5J3_9CHLR|nr:DUF2382 domain-containing protein [Dictyobacter alpinus]GCE26616.1 hypothetical protein KDA_21000 [Dictyobacter alpinus]